MEEMALINPQVYLLSSNLRSISALKFYKMKAKKSKIASVAQDPTQDDDVSLPGYPLYPPSDDVYRNSKRVEIIDSDDVLDNGLDVPGSELDDQQESVGSEDEENNYYSLGGDDPNNLEEDWSD